MPHLITSFFILGLLLIAGCGRDEPQSPTSNGAVDEQLPQEAIAAADEVCPNYVASGQPLFGDLHVHTSYSFDAAANATGATPVDAQRYAQGEVIPFFPIGEDGVAQGTAQD